MSSEDDRYAVFRTVSDGVPYWVEGVGSLTEGKLKLRKLAAQDGATEYFLYDLLEARKLLSTRDERT